MTKEGQNIGDARLPLHGADMHSDKVGPQHDCENPLPETQVQEPDGEEPSGTPQAASKAMLLDAYLRGVLGAGVGFHDFPPSVLQRVWAGPGTVAVRGSTDWWLRPFVAGRVLSTTGCPRRHNLRLNKKDIRRQRNRVIFCATPGTGQSPLCRESNLVRPVQSREFEKGD